MVYEGLSRRSPIPASAVLLAAAILTLPSFPGVAVGQEAPAAPAPAAAPAARAKATPEEAVQAALTKQATVASERRGALHLRDLTQQCGVAEADVPKLRDAMSVAIGKWIEAHPPRQYQPFAPDFSAILQSPEWTQVFEKTASADAQRKFKELRESRRRRLVDATAAFVRTFAACELRMTPEQYAAITPVCNDIAEQAIDIEYVYALPSQLVDARDRGAVRVLSEVQADQAARARSRGQGRDAVTEFELESERIRLVCALDEERAHLLRACGRNEGRKRIAADAAGKAEQAKKIEEAKKALEALKAEAAKNPDDAQKADEVRKAEEAQKADETKRAEAAKKSLPNGLPKTEVLDAPFWTKVRDSVLTAKDREKLSSSASIDVAAVRAARVELSLARLIDLFHLDAKQVESLRGLAEKVADEELKSPQVSSLDVLRGFGMRIDYQETTPEQRAARRALEDLLDPLQFEVLRDRTGL
jgi:hypothetical protein